MPHHTSAATLQGFMLHSWNSWFVNSHWYPGIPTHACCIPVLWEVRFNFEKRRFPSNHLSGSIIWWWTAGVQEKQALLCQQPSMQMNWPCHIFIHFSHIYGTASNHEVNPSLEGNYSIPEFGMSLISLIFSYYFLSVHFHFRVPFRRSCRSPLQGFPPSDACSMLEKAPALFLQIYPANKSSVEISPWRTFGATFLLKHLRHFFGSFFLLPLVRYTLTFFKECLPLPFESQETTAQLLFNLAAAGRELLSISQTLPGLLDVEIIWAGFLQKLATRTILLGHSRSPSRKPFKAANIANSSCQIWQNVLESHLSSHAVPTEPAHDGSAWCDWELVSLLQCEPFSMANAVISWRFSSSSVQPSCVNDFVELHCFSRSGKHRFIILNLLNDKKLRVVQCGWFGWFGPIAHRKFDKTGSRKERHNGVCNLVCNFFGFVLKIPCALGHCNLFHTSCQDAFQAMPHPGSSCHSVHLGPQDLRFQNQVHKQRRMMRWIFEQFYVGP